MRLTVNWSKLETNGILYQLLEALEYMSDEILTVSEVAKHLKVAEKTVYTMAQKSEIPCFKVRGQWRFRSSDLNGWITEQSVVTPPIHLSVGDEKKPHELERK